jgi:two-component system chemotaxis sensor kinase CheA
MRTDANDAMSDHPVFSEGMVEIVESFVVEAKDILDQIDRDIPQLEQADASVPLIDRIFRGVHTVKGLSTFLRLEQLSLISHHFEEVLNRFRGGKQDFHPGMKNVMLRAVEAMNQLVQQLPDRSITLIPLDGLLEDLELLAQDGLSGEIILKNGSSERKQTTPYRMRSTVTHTESVSAADVFTRFRAFTRELAKDLDKKLDVVFEGGDIVIDHAMVGDLTDPLLHLARNAVDHGIELPEERIRRDKPVRGRILLRAAGDGDGDGEGSHVLITVEDDGDGIDVRTLCRRAVECGIVTDQEASTMAHSEMMNLIFKPGFTTHNEATRISGRGVGMDVVKTSVQRLGGTVHVESEPGRYTRFTLRLPQSAPTRVHA